jgi:hypothetical protein
MKTFSKVLIGVGTQSGDITRICIDITPVQCKLQENQPVSLIAEPMSEPDIFGRTHEVFALLISRLPDQEY